ncbi:hypothetical protein BCR34DRAFT_627610 [Clohesyomyces aquaticus]|uniref:ribonuclease H n=1 Tax=Clohesyomyces aquaticus TaxID=1231657 RepID=A0A1Y1YVU8_9PLEO|nr:hypothetical protein BCR34DRAFT_627610 [Clohesyomyces aquaticus]
MRAKPTPFVLGRVVRLQHQSRRRQPDCYPNRDYFTPRIRPHRKALPRLLQLLRSIAVPPHRLRFETRIRKAREQGLLCSIFYTAGRTGALLKLAQAMADAKSASTTSSGEKKRKRAAPGFYAVKNGKEPGIYYSWQDTLAQITGFKNAVRGFRSNIGTDKKFSTLTEAEAFMNSDKAAAGKPTQQKFYAVQSGRVPGVYTDWPSARAQITGWKGVKHKSFATRAEAEAFVAAAKGFTSVEGTPTLNGKEDVESEASIPDARKGCKVGDNASNKKQKKNDGSALTPIANGDYEPGTGLLPPDAEDGFDRNITFNAATGAIECKSEDQLQAKKLQPTGEFSGPIVIYTDGSSLGNGTSGAVAGVGVYFGSNDPRNISEALSGPRQTNQRAELAAILRAVDTVPIDADVLIYSDSNYAIKCCTEWFQKWRANGWKNAAGKAVDNRDIIEPIVARIEERVLAKGKTKFTWLKGHAGAEGNVAADALAVSGAREALVRRQIGN